MLLRFVLLNGETTFPNSNLELETQINWTGKIVIIPWNWNGSLRKLFEIVDKATVEFIW